MPVPERIRLVEEIWESIAEVPEAVPIVGVSLDGPPGPHDHTAGTKRKRVARNIGRITLISPFVAS